MKTYQFILTITLLSAITACKQTPIDQPQEPGEVKVFVITRDVNKSMTTKAKSIDGFSDKSMIGIYTAEENSDYPLSSLDRPKDHNIGYKANQESSYWQPLPNQSPILYTPMQTITLFAYHPYSLQQNSSITTLTMPDNTVAASIKIKQKQYTTDSITLCDVMFAKCKEISQTNSVAELIFEHKLTKLTFSIIKGASWGTTTVKLTHLAISGDNINLNATMSLFDGKLTVVPNSQNNTIEWAATQLQPLTLGSLTPSTIELIVLPGVAEGTKLQFIANGLPYQYTLQQKTFAPATNYEYKVTLNTETDVEPINIEPSIQNWEVKSDIEIRPI